MANEIRLRTKTLETIDSGIKALRELGRQGKLADGEAVPVESVQQLHQALTNIVQLLGEDLQKAADGRPRLAVDALSTAVKDLQQRLAPATPAAPVQQTVQPPGPAGLFIRWYARRDLDEVLAIEEQSFPPGNAWNREQFIHALRCRDTMMFVAELQDGRIVGYVVYSFDRREFLIANLAVHPDHRRCGIGSALVAKLQSKLQPDKRRFLNANVLETSVGAQLFFKAREFTARKLSAGAVSEIDLLPEGYEGDVYRFEYRV